MRGLFLIAALLILPSVASAQSCRELQLACEMKGSLGEQGQGNCRRFREVCQPRPQRGPNCADLRAACLHKEDLGERGRGNCEAYRAQCTRG